MKKMLETLQTLSRVLLLLAVSMIAAVASYKPEPPNYPFDSQAILDQIERMNKGYDGMIGEIKKEATIAYQRQLLESSGEIDGRTRDIIKRMSFIPASITTSYRYYDYDYNGYYGDLQISPISIGLMGSNLWVGTLFDFIKFYEDTASYKVWRLDFGEFINHINSLEKDPKWRSLFTALDFVVVVNDLYDDSNSRRQICRIEFHSQTWEKQNPHLSPSGISKDITCSAPDSPMETNWWGDFLKASREGSLVGYVPPEVKELRPIPAETIKKTLDSVAIENAKEEQKSNVFGATFAIKDVLIIGPLAILVLILMLIGQVRWVSQLPEQEQPAESAFWFSQFLGVLAVPAMLAMWLLPAVAVGMAVNRYILDEILLYGDYPPIILGLDLKTVISFVVSMLLSGWMVLENWRAARKWRKRLEDSISKQQASTMQFQPNVYTFTAFQIIPDETAAPHQTRERRSPGG